MTARGLVSSRWVEPIEEFVRTHGRETPRWAVVLTYEIELDRVARVLMPALSRRGRQFKTVVLADAGPLERALASFPRAMPGAVNFHPVRMRGRGIFHPKLVLLRAGRQARVVFGSANLTSGGMGGNLEFWTHSEDPRVVAGLADVVRRLARAGDRGITIDPAGTRALMRATLGMEGRPTDDVWTSLDGPFSKRLRQTPGPCDGRPLVISPLYASQDGLRAARAAIPARVIDLYTSIPAVVQGTRVFAYDPPHAADSAADDAQAMPGTLHAKAYVFRGARGRHVAWVGSANFTAPALTMTVAAGGNLELLVRTPLADDELVSLMEDLTSAFHEGAAARHPPAPEERMPPPRATVLSCELVGTGAALRLRVFTTIRSGRVVLSRNGVRVTVTVRRATGSLSGPVLRRLLGGLDLSVAQSVVLHQILGRSRVPIIVNVPLVPAEDDDGEVALGNLVDELLGRIRVVQSSEDDETPIEDAVDDPDDDTREEVERRLDEVIHQGELDRLAVKTALLARLARRAAKAGSGRDAVLEECARALARAAPQHIASMIRASLLSGGGK